MPSKPKPFFLILILGTLTALSPFSIDMYLPAFSEIAKDLDTPAAEVALSLSSYFIGLAFGQLLYGPLLDRFGRKKPLYVGLFVYILASFGCMFSRSIDELVIFRLIQAIGGCVANVASVAMVRDFFRVKESSKVFSLLILVLGVSPLLAPTVGGYISTNFGWHAIFIILSAIAFLMLLVSVFYLPESHKADPSVSLKPIHIFHQYGIVFRNPQFYSYTLAGAVAFSGLFVYISGSPIIFMEIFKVEPQKFSYIFALLSVGFIGASQCNIFLVKKFKNEQILKTALLGQVAVTLLFLIGTWNGWFGLIGTTLFFFSLLALVGLLNPNAAALALAPFSKNAGTASALMGSLQMGIGAFASSCVGLFSAHTSLPLSIILFASASFAFLILMIGKRRIPEELPVHEEITPAISV
ncbi:multidrug effflux MFS transporter [Leptospira tipperaryensis]|uniref:multidrug effflux MFS transporter n=1 Tax=Leptospira tipperaryensis TaxID=2564040 RepID=UPI001C54EF9F|nr:multidrug effflux MFS transporter [Leptospira tipperaryensis]